MDQRRIGIIILVTGLLITGSIAALKAQADRQTDALVHETGTCYTEEGTCIHQQQATAYVIAWTLAAAIIILGLYLLFFDKTYQILVTQQRQLTQELEAAKHKDEFKAYLAGFNEEERQVIKAVHEQDGIKQSTLRYRTGMSKTSLSLLLASLEERGAITRKIAGKTKEVYLRKRF